MIMMVRQSHEYLGHNLTLSFAQVLGEVCNFVAYAFADAILVTPLGTWSFSFLDLFPTRILI